MGRMRLTPLSFRRDLSRAPQPACEIFGIFAPTLEYLIRWMGSFAITAAAGRHVVRATREIANAQREVVAATDVEWAQSGMEVVSDIEEDSDRADHRRAMVDADAPDD